MENTVGANGLKGTFSFPPQSYKHTPWCFTSDWADGGPWAVTRPQTLEIANSLLVEQLHSSWLENDILWNLRPAFEFSKSLKIINVIVIFIWTSGFQNTCFNLVSPPLVGSVHREACTSCFVLLVRWEKKNKEKGGIVPETVSNGNPGKKDNYCLLLHFECSTNFQFEAQYKFLSYTCFHFCWVVQFLWN